jgi:predicted MFS family arabinose efflux permease
VHSVEDESSFDYPGWKVAGAALFGVMVSFAAMVPYTFSLFLNPLEGAFGWKRAAISRAFGIAAMTVAVCSPGIGMLLDKLPPRRVILPSIAVFAVAMASLSLLTHNIAQYYLTYLVLGIVGNGTAQLAYSRAVLTWFDRKRGLAMAVVLTGSGLGSIVLPILTQHVLAIHGWRAAYLVLGMTALLGLPLTALLVRNRPNPQTTAPEVSSTMRIGQVLRTPVFWLIAFPVMFAALSLNALVAHLSALLTSRGVTASDAALALSMLGISGILGRLVTGHLLDRVFAPHVSLAVLVLAGLGVAAEAHATTTAVGLAGAFLLGFAAGSEADVVPYLVARYYGRARFATIYGLSWTAYAVGGALGPVLLGRAYDQDGRYTPVSVLLLSLPCFVAALLQLALPRYSGHPLTSSTMNTLAAAAESAIEPV